jgi:hypothetical protein
VWRSGDAFLSVLYFKKVIGAFLLIVKRFIFCIRPAFSKYDKDKNLKKGLAGMMFFNKIALSFVILFSVTSILNTYLGETERAQSNFVYLLLNGFAYIVSAMEVENEKQLARA